VDRYLLTGCAGFIASKVAELLLEAGHRVVGVDNVNDAYDPLLKEWRLARLEGYPGFCFHRLDITDRPAVQRLFENDARPDTESRRPPIPPSSTWRHGPACGPPWRIPGCTTRPTATGR